MLGPTESDVVEEVESFCYLGSVLDREGVERAVRARAAAAWAKRLEIAGLLCDRRILYGAESWLLTQRLEKCIQSCDRRQLRYMSGVSLRDRVSKKEVAQRCGLKEILDVIIIIIDNID